MASYTSKTKVKDLPLSITADGKYFIEVGGPSAQTGNFNTIYALGGFGGGTVSISITPDGTDDTKDVPVPASALVTPGFVNILAKSRGIVIDVVGSAGPTLSISVL